MIVERGKTLGKAATYVLNPQSSIMEMKKNKNEPNPLTDSKEYGDFLNQEVRARKVKK